MSPFLGGLGRPGCGVSGEARACSASGTFPLVSTWRPLPPPTPLVLNGHRISRLVCAITQEHLADETVGGPRNPGPDSRWASSQLWAAPPWVLFPLCYEDPGDPVTCRYPYLNGGGNGAWAAPCASPLVPQRPREAGIRRPLRWGQSCIPGVPEGAENDAHSRWW